MFFQFLNIEFFLFLQLFMKINDIPPRNVVFVCVCVCVCVSVGVCVCVYCVRGLNLSV